jgi:hypothetical protein
MLTVPQKEVSFFVLKSALNLNDTALPPSQLEILACPHRKSKHIDVCLTHLTVPSDCCGTKNLVGEDSQ